MKRQSTLRRRSYRPRMIYFNVRRPMTDTAIATSANGTSDVKSAVSSDRVSATSDAAPPVVISAPGSISRRRGFFPQEVGNRRPLHRSRGGASVRAEATYRAVGWDPRACPLLMDGRTDLRCGPHRSSPGGRAPAGCGGSRCPSLSRTLAILPARAQPPRGVDGAARPLRMARGGRSTRRVVRGVALPTEMERGSGMPHWFSGRPSIPARYMPRRRASRGEHVVVLVFLALGAIALGIYEFTVEGR